MRHRLSADLDDEGRGGSRHRVGRDRSAGAGGGQDRHHQRCARCVVRRLYQQYRRRVLYRPRPAARPGPGAYGSSMCGPVFQEFMTEAVKKYGGGPFEVPPGGHFIKIDRFTGARLPDDASKARMSWPNISATARSRSSAYVRWRLCHGRRPASFTAPGETSRSRTSPPRPAKRAGRRQGELSAR